MSYDTLHLLVPRGSALSPHRPDAADPMKVDVKSQAWHEELFSPRLAQDVQSN